MEKKFIKTTDKPTADKLTAYGFKLIAHSGNTYTFLNDAPSHFNFDAVDNKMIVYDNILSL